MDKRICLQCKKPLVGRVDQKFCDAQCRNAFHNQHKRDDEQYISQVNTAIRRNRRILKDLCPEGKATVRREVLESKGFDYRYFSGTYATVKLIYYISYDYGFAAVTDQGKEKALIIQKQNYMDNYQLNPWKVS
jgi:hypothetical protein